MTVIRLQVPVILLNLQDISAKLKTLVCQATYF